MPSTLFSLVAVLLGGVLLQAQSASAVAPLTPPICSTKCTITALGAAGCALKDIRNCLCTNMTLQLELATCVYKSCNHTEQQTATQILQEKICVGVPFESRKTELLRAEFLLAAITYPIIILRMISRVWVARKVWWDDWMIVFAVAFMIPNTVIPIWTAYQGFGLHIWNVEPHKAIILGKLYYVATIFYALIQNLAKFSILFLYLRIFPAPDFSFIVKIAIGFMLCHTIAFTSAIIFQCTPIEVAWSPSGDSKCINMHTLAIAGAIASIVEDLVIITLPINQLLALRISRRKRSALFFMFAVGSFACVASMIRLKVIIDFFPNPNLDSTWTAISPTIWSDIETYMAINCSCIMCLRPLFSKAFPKVFGTTNATTDTNTTTNAGSDSKPKSYSKRSTTTPPKVWADKWGSTYDTQSRRSEEDVIIQQSGPEELELRKLPTNMSNNTNGRGSPGSDRNDSYHHGV
ncbi:hypothetical protein WAI453_004052 [Rhynchosporium graminicola]